MIATQKDSLAPAALTKGRAEAALAGTTLADRYDILELLGVGGMGAVYRARDRELDDLVALKVIRRDLAALPAMVERFRHEVKLARRVTHVNVARTFELGTSNGLMYCTMELVEGESLSQRLEQRRKLPVAEAVAIACAVCDGLATAHAANVIHRDIKPDNILLANDGRVVIADFGVAAVGAGVGKIGELSGTPAYMAPEQARGESATPASDVYAVATVLYELLTGKRAFAGEAMTVLSAKQTVERLAPSDAEVPAELGAVIGSATARDPALRTASAAALRDALAPWAKSAALPALSPRTTREADSDLTTIVVLAPQVASHPQLYLAEAVHEALLARLSRMPRVRVLPRVNGRIDESVVGVCLDLIDKFHVRIIPPRGQTTILELPLAVDQVDEAADAVAAALGVILRPRKLASSEATDLLLRARHLLSRDFTRVPEGVEKLERAYELAPEDPRIVANYLIAKVRLAFFRSANPRLAESFALARSTVAAHPELADAQLAAGHVELAVGDPLAAAGHFRAAIRCAPHLAEAHEQLGRMLLEAGYMDAALERLDEAIAIAPNLRTARWELLRAYALDKRWPEFDVLLAELVAAGDRPLARSRYLWWRGDWAGLEDARAHITHMDRTLWPGMMESMFEVFLDAGWEKHRDAVLAAAHAPVESHRRTAFMCQLAAEAAAFSGDTDATITLIVRAIDKGLFDLHWIDHCVMLAPVRSDPRFTTLRRLVKERADAILDALYGDHVAVSETVAQ